MSFNLEIDIQNLGPTTIVDNSRTRGEGEPYEVYIMVQTGKRAGDTRHLLTTRGPNARAHAEFILKLLQKQ